MYEYHIVYENGSEGYIYTDSEEQARMIGEKLSTSKIKSISQTKKESFQNERTI